MVGVWRRVLCLSVSDQSPHAGLFIPYCSKLIPSATRAALAVKHVLYYDSSMTTNNWQDVKDSFARRNAEIFELRTKHDLTFSEIADRFGITNARVQAICKKLNHENGKDLRPKRTNPKRRT